MLAACAHNKAMAEWRMAFTRLSLKRQQSEEAQKALESSFIAGSRSRINTACSGVARSVMNVSVGV